MVGKSTVPVGTANQIAEILKVSAPGVDVAWNPEFLREGFAVQDTLEPDRLVVGVRSPEAESQLREVYAANDRQGNSVPGHRLPHRRVGQGGSELVS